MELEISLSEVIKFQKTQTNMFFLICGSRLPNLIYVFWDMSPQEAGKGGS